MTSHAATPILSGLAGAAALTSIHEFARRTLPNAPRMDVVAMRALTRGRRMAGVEQPPSHAYAQTLAGDLISNSAYYSLVAIGDRQGVWTRGATLGALAGLGALLLPPRLGLGDPPRSERWSNRIMTVAWYLAGGLVAAATANALARDDGRDEYRDRDTPVADTTDQDRAAALWTSC